MPFRLFGAFSVSKICGVVGSLGEVTLAGTVIYDAIKKIAASQWRRARSAGNRTAAAAVDDASTDNTPVSVRLAIYVELLTLMVHMLSVVLSFLLVGTEAQCRVLVPANCFLFHLSGALLYLIFVRRIDLIYADTLFTVPFYHIFNLYAGITLYVAPYLIYVDWFVIDAHFDREWGCGIDPLSLSSLLLAVAMAMHSAIAVYSLYLFVFPLLHLIQVQDSFNNPRVSDKLYSVMIKYSILYSCSILTSLVLLAVNMAHPIGYAFSLVSSLVNGIVLILLHPIQNKLYKKICCWAHSLCAIACGAPRDSDQLRDRRAAADPPKVELVDLELAPNGNVHHGSKHSAVGSLRSQTQPMSIVSYSNHGTLTVHRLKSPKSSLRSAQLTMSAVSPPLTTLHEDLSQETYADTLERMASPPMFVRGNSTSLAMEIGVSPRSTESVRAPPTDRLCSVSPRIASPPPSHADSAQRVLTASERVFSVQMNHDINHQLEMASQLKRSGKSSAPLVTVMVEPSLPDVMEEEPSMGCSPQSRHHHRNNDEHRERSPLSGVDLEALWKSTSHAMRIRETLSGRSQVAFLGSWRSNFSVSRAAPTSSGGAFFSQHSGTMPSTSWRSLEPDVVETFRESILSTLRFLDRETTDLF